MLLKVRASQYYQCMGNFASMESALVVFALALIGLFLELVTEGRASKARQGRIRFLRPTPPAVTRTYTVRGLGQWQYQVATSTDDEF